MRPSLLRLLSRMDQVAPPRARAHDSRGLAKASHTEHLEREELEAVADDVDVRVRVAVLGVDIEDERQLLHRADLLALPSGWLNSAAERPKMPRPAACEQVQKMASFTFSMSRMRTANE